MVTTKKGERPTIFLSVVIPVYNEELSLATLYTRLISVLKNIKLSYEIIFVDDCSEDNSFKVISQLREEDKCVKCLKFSRNFGHQIALTAGLECSSGQVVITMDSDLQDPPEVIPSLVQKYHEGYDIVYAIRDKREGETKIKVFTAFIFYRLFNLLSNISIPFDVGDFRLMSRRVVNALLLMKERDRFVRGLVSWVGFRSDKVTYKREKRYAGRTKYHFLKMLKFAFNAIMSFSRFPLRLAILIGMVCGLLSFLYLGISMVYFFLGKSMIGWTSIIALIVFLGSIQLLCIGVVGEYVGMIFDEVKNRPLFVVETQKGFNDDVARI